MKQSRLDSLSDGIFAIVLTFLTFDLKVPKLLSATDNNLWIELKTLGPTFLSFILSFALIFSYWRAHHYIVSIYAKTVNRRLTSINALFFFFIALIPFSTKLIGDYSETKLAIIIYSLNIICIGVSLLWMRSHVFASGQIDHKFVPVSERQRGVVRVVLPIVCASMAIALSFLNTNVSFILLTVAIVFNLVSSTTVFINWAIRSAKEELA